MKHIIIYLLLAFAATAAFAHQYENGLPTDGEGILKAISLFSQQPSHQKVYVIDEIARAQTSKSLANLSEKASPYQSENEPIDLGPLGIFGNKEILSANRSGSTKGQSQLALPMDDKALSSEERFLEYSEPVEQIWSWEEEEGYRDSSGGITVIWSP